MSNPENTQSNKAIAIWLFLCCGLVMAMVVLGGITRLTGSGLSMVRWEPLVGILPPLDEAAWQNMFQLYRESPEFRLVNAGMDLAAFKGIFWLEYFHRLLGRLLGVIFLLPLVYFVVRKRIDESLAMQLTILFLLGAMQGAMGWLMVQSGLIHDPHVSHYRLTLHLGFAFVILAYMLWIAMGLWPWQSTGDDNSTGYDAAVVKPYAWGLSGLIFTTAMSGGLVAGLRAGMAYNTFPLMDGRLFPEDYFLLEPAYLNLLDNVPAVQWDHRLLAMITLSSVVLFVREFYRYSLTRWAKIVLYAMLAMVMVQVGLGIATLLLFVPIPLASAHQTGAIILFALTFYLGCRLHWQDRLAER